MNGTLPIKIEDWFDVEDQEHLLAYKYLHKEGVWPENFIPKFVVLGGNWVAELNTMLAEAHIKNKVKSPQKSVGDIVTAITAIHDAIEAEMVYFNAAKDRLQEHYDDVEELKDELEDAIDRLEDSDIGWQNGLSFLDDATNEFEGAMSELDIICE